MPSAKILMLQTRPNRRAAELAKELGVSMRSVHRYMQMLDEMGTPIYTERGPYGGFSLQRGYQFPPLIFTREEAVALSLGARLATDVFGALYCDTAISALAKLENVLPEEQRVEAAWAKRALIVTGIHRAVLHPAAHIERLRFLPKFADIAAEITGLSESIETLADGAVEVTLSVPDVIRGASTALSFGSAAVVLDPPKIRSLVRTWAGRVAAQYLEPAP